MRKALAAIFVGFVTLIIIFMVIGGVFDRPFWLAFLPGLMANLAILFVAVFVIDRMFQEERWDKLKKINARQSEIVLFLSNRMAYWLMEYLGLANEEEIQSDKTMKFEFAIGKIKATDLAEAFYEEMRKSEVREAFVGGFVKKLYDGTEGVLKALDAIYPRPDPEAKKLADEIIYSSGTLEGFKGVLGAIKEANVQVRADRQFNSEQVDLLIKVAYSRVGSELQKIRNNIVELSQRAKANRLFVSLD
jgi:hypothetical protein